MQEVPVRVFCWWSIALCAFWWEVFSFMQQEPKNPFNKSFYKFLVGFVVIVVSTLVLILLINLEGAETVGK